MGCLSNLNVISYNVEELLSKLNDDSFFKNLEDFDTFFFLLETFIDTGVLPDDLLPSFIRYFSPALKLSATDVALVVQLCL